MQDNQFARVHGNVGFNPLPIEEREHGAVDDRCCCTVSEWIL